MSATKGLSLHIGLNRIDPAHYGTNGALSGCESDARAMKKIADKAGFRSTVLLNENATSATVIRQISQAAQQLSSADIFFLSFAGHGAQIPDVSGDESDDHRDETWCAYDRMILDDELNECWSKFPAGSRILMISDSCHSGTVARLLRDSLEGRASRTLGDDAIAAPRALSKEQARYAFDHHPDIYRRVRTLGQQELPAISASVLLLSGCQDKQSSGDGAANGVFTGNLLEVWADGSFEGSYLTLYEKLKKLMTKYPLQTPNYFLVGAPSERFESQRPFTINDEHIGSKAMSEHTGLDPRVLKLLKPGMRPEGNESRDVSGECSISIDFNRSLIDGKSDEQIMMFFQNDVAPRMMDNWLSGISAINPTTRSRGGSFSCTVSGSREASVSCTGSYTW